MTYRENVSAFAKALGISNDPCLREEDLTISELRFTDGKGNLLTKIEATPMNRGGRLFFQLRGTINRKDEDRMASLWVNDRLRGDAADYFAELWEPNPEPGKRQLLDAIRNPNHIKVELVWK